MGEPRHPESELLSTFVHLTIGLLYECGCG